DLADVIEGFQRRPVLLVDLRRRRDVRLEDRQQRLGVQQPAADRRLHRGRSGAVRAHLRGERRGSGSGQPSQGVLMTVTATRPTGALAGTSGTGLRKVKDRLATTLIYGSFLIALIPLVWLLWTVLSRGLHALTRNGWFTASQRGITYRDPGGVVLHAVIGTLEQVLLCTAISVPIALLVAIYLVEYGQSWRPLVRSTTFMVDILTGIP